MSLVFFLFLALLRKNAPHCQLFLLHWLTFTFMTSQKFELFSRLKISSTSTKPTNTSKLVNFNVNAPNLIERCCPSILCETATT